ncbi:ABC transporter ATP-binding protein [Acidilutibacter cellobiosedens]|uniref:ABC transporter ATP-binding protein n=1 Tax=Acidilutibacter cellobiosedens TaxID=2507161 RepID=A0A410QBU5_9FIRM|nr:ABC transporter ATP-binding protein [Acidilutibacter cellobiosedens]MBE6082146.1 ABC transporter ATP-binding protein [Tissierellaceae bacterium]QAT61334.1 ABC transporter ATP-binding protein [Acidilutibacter cellobiosedens]
MKNLIIETKKLNKKYGKQIVVNNVDLHIEQGEIYGLLGRNGAGKTTIMKMILGLVSITSGEINVFGQKLKGNEQQIYPRIGAIIETPGFYPNLTGTENLRIFAKLRGMTRKDCIKHALDLVGLSYNDKKLFLEYSLGMKQRLGIANAVMHEPELLILDEPTNGLDPIGIVEMREFIRDLCKKNGITILISSHILTEIEQLADTIGIIDHGILLEESSYKDLQKKNRKYILLKVSSTSNAIRVLEQKMGIHDYEVENDTMLRIYEIDRNMGEINKLLITNNIEVLSSQFCSDTLEDYFKNITGGEGIV